MSDLTEKDIEDVLTDMEESPELLCKRQIYIFGKPTIEVMGDRKAFERVQASPEEPSE